MRSKRRPFSSTSSARSSRPGCGGVSSFDFSSRWRASSSARVAVPARRPRRRPSATWTTTTERARSHHAAFSTSAGARSRCSRAIATASPIQTSDERDVDERVAADAEREHRADEDDGRLAACRRRARRTNRSPAWPCTWPRGWSAGTARGASCSGSNSRCCSRGSWPTARRRTSGTARSTCSRRARSPAG